MFAASLIQNFKASLFGYSVRSTPGAVIIDTSSGAGPSRDNHRFTVWENSWELFKNCGKIQLKIIQFMTCLPCCSTSSLLRVKARVSDTAVRGQRNVIATRRARVIQTAAQIMSKSAVDLHLLAQHHLGLRPATAALDIAGRGLRTAGATPSVSRIKTVAGTTKRCAAVPVLHLRQLMISPRRCLI